MNNENQQTASTQGSANLQEDQLGGATNLSLEQLKSEGGIAGTSDDNPDRLSDQDDLNEIRAADDLDEPDTEEFQPDEEDNEQVGGEQESGEETDAVNDADGNGEPANPTELNS
jgi:hypothetical protein